jgi:5-oxoprolinase (ATP-hydrolysing)/N-methylhydantoinase A
MPLFNLTLTRCVKALLEHFPAETLKPGDVLVTNDPWLCAGHLFDIALVTPVFRDGRVVTLMGTVGHVADIGGIKDALGAREMYDEGVLIPPMKLYDAGVPDRSLLRLLAANIRNPDQVLGDVEAMVTANALGAERLGAFMDEYGLDDLAALAAVVQGRSEAATRAAIRVVPDGVYKSEIENRPLGEPLRYRVQVHKRGDSVHVEHVDAPRQLPRGGVNCVMNVTAGHSSYPLKCMLTPTIRGNSGCYAPIEVTAPPGSVLNCEKPASVSYRTRVSWWLGPNLYRALAPAIPDRVQAFTGMPKAFGFYGRDAQGRLASDHLFMGGGQGASLHGDGKSGLLFPTSAAGTPVELFESRVPVLVLEKTLVADSGGAGRQRGGLGQRMRARRLDGGLDPVLVGLYPEGWRVAVEGLFGGRPGGGSHGLVHGPGGETHDVGVGELVSLFDAETSIEAQLTGGSGFGDPLERPVEAVEADLADGYITAEGAARDYGCVVGADGRIDAAATARRRAALKTKEEAATTGD